MAQPSTVAIEDDHDFVDLVTSARRLGQYRWLEQRLFELLGGWVTGTADAAAKAQLSTLAMHHAAHAELLATVLPTLSSVDGVTPDELTEAPPDRDDADGGAGLADVRGLVLVVEALADVDTTPARLERLRTVVLPGLVASYRTFRDRLSAVGDRPARRVLALLVADLGDDLALLSVPSV